MEMSDEYLDQVMKAASTVWAKGDKYTRYRGFTWGDLAPVLGLPMDSEHEDVIKLNEALHLLAEKGRLTIDRSAQPDRFKPKRTRR